MFKAISALVMVIAFMVSSVLAGLENPAPNSVKSGVSVVSGWMCDAEELEVSFDGGPRQFVPYGSERSDTAGVCGDTDNGFGLLINYNELGDGEHTLTFYVDGRKETTRTFFVATLDTPYLQDVNGTGRIVLSNGYSVLVTWDQAVQGFTILDYVFVPKFGAFGSFIGIWQFTGGAGDVNFTKTYDLVEMQSNMTHRGHVTLLGTDEDGGQAVILIGTDDLLPGQSTPYTLALADQDEVTTSDQRLCVQYFMYAVSPNDLEGRAFLSPYTESGCQFGTPLGDPNGYPFTANRIE